MTGSVERRISALERRYAGMTIRENGREPAGPFGVLLAQLMTNRGWTRTHLSLNCDTGQARVSRSEVSRILSGERTPSLVMVRTIADALDVTDATRLRLYVAASETAAARRNGGER